MMSASLLVSPSLHVPPASSFIHLAPSLPSISPVHLPSLAQNEAKQQAVHLIVHTAMQQPQILREQLGTLRGSPASSEHDIRLYRVTSPPQLEESCK